MGRRCIGMDVHREFAQIAVWEDGLVRQAGQIASTLSVLTFTSAIARVFCGIPAVGLELTRPFSREIELLDTIPGVDKRAAQSCSPRSVLT